MIVETLELYAGVFERCFVVVRERDGQVIEQIEESLGARVDILQSGKSNLGIGASLAEGVRQIVEEHDLRGLFIGLGDMPSIRKISLVALREEMRKVIEDVRGCILRPEFGGLPGHPVGFSREYFEDLLRADGDVGARQILELHPNCVKFLRLKDPGICLDFDLAG